MITVERYCVVADRVDDEDTLDDATLITMTRELDIEWQALLREPASTPEAIAAKIEIVIDRMQLEWDGGTPHDVYLNGIREEVLGLGVGQSGLIPSNQENLVCRPLKLTRAIATK